ncbi:MAG: lipid-A-disaccharide synthase [Muribaculaceae bacterium]|nr:lipid-A-disaccharide synthase [Muribaculaceae bacterium]
MHYFIIAGEASGDLHGAHLIQALRRHDPDAVITFLGGDKMAEASGEQPVIHYRDMAFMGFSEVLRNIGKIGRNLSKAREALRMAKPDCLILIDYPSFNLKVAATAAKENIPVYYYISPKIWAWKKWRLATIKKRVKKVLCILPFEPTFYKANKAPIATYVGNPSVEEVDAAMLSVLPREEFLKKHKLRDRPLIALMPGSRLGEIRNNLAVMRLAADTFPQYRPVIIAAPGIDDEVYNKWGGIRLPILRDDAVQVLAHCRAALVTSGTATLETALCGIPQVVCYRANGAKISYDIMEKILDIEFVSLPNLIAGKKIVPEMLVHNCTPSLVADQLGPLLRQDSPERLAQTEGYTLMREILGRHNAADNAASIIVGDLRS